LIQTYNSYFDCANIFKNIFQLFSKVLKIKEKKTAANSTLAALKRPPICQTIKKVGGKVQCQTFYWVANRKPLCKYNNFIQ